MDYVNDAYGNTMVDVPNGGNYMTNKEIFNVYEALTSISNNSDLKFSIKTSFLLAKNKVTLEPLYNAIIETRQNALNTYGIPEGDSWTIPKEKVDDFMKLWNDFMNMDNDITLQHININQFEGGDIEMGVMEKLLPIIDVTEFNDEFPINSII